MTKKEDFRVAGGNADYLRAVLVFFVAALLGLGRLAHGSPPTATTRGLSAAAIGEPRLHSLLQTWFYDDTSGAAVVGRSADFRLRRAEIGLEGTVTPSIRYFVMIDPAKLVTGGDTKILQDLGAGLKLLPSLELVAGQFRTPTVAEGLDPNGELLFPERSLVARAYGEKREPGAMLVLREPSWMLSVMVSNGQGPNASDTNDSKDLSARAEAYPTDEFVLGAFTTMSDFSFRRAAAWGADARWKSDPIYLRVSLVVAQANGLTSMGGVGEGAYWVTDKIQPAVRFEYLSPDISYTGKTPITANAATFGVNYYLHGQAAKAQLAATTMARMYGNAGSPVYDVNQPRHTLVHLAVQIAI